mmetsp:Transcript_134123/g.428549  ORF Transcript_134123/g.428549 Transcript_134123/m.428549 type:complete len:238 (+) Transcript_134123:1041-1754(+)
MRHDARVHDQLACCSCLCQTCDHCLDRPCTQCIEVGMGSALGCQQRDVRRNPDQGPDNVLHICGARALHQPEELSAGADVLHVHATLREAALDSHRHLDACPGQILGRFGAVEAAPSTSSLRLPVQHFRHDACPSSNSASHNCSCNTYSDLLCMFLRLLSLGGTNMNQLGKHVLCLLQVGRGLGGKSDGRCKLVMQGCCICRACHAAPERVQHLLRLPQVRSRLKGNQPVSSFAGGS